MYHINDRFVYGFGCTDLELEGSIRDYQDIQVITNHIKQAIKKGEGRDVNVVILYWRPFEEKEVGEAKCDVLLIFRIS